ncbi:MAG: hypothetical protein QM740_01755 [Acidovorax sp.]
MDRTLLTILGCVLAWCGLIVLAMALIQRSFSRDRARQERAGILGSYTP